MTERRVGGGGMARAGLGVASVLAWAAFAPLAVLAAAPSPSPLTGDPRSAGEGPGLVGEPLFAIGVVVLIALVAVVATPAGVLATGGRPERGGGARR